MSVCRERTSGVIGALSRGCRGKRERGPETLKGATVLLRIPRLGARMILGLTRVGGDDEEVCPGPRDHLVIYFARRLDRGMRHRRRLVWAPSSQRPRTLTLWMDDLQAACDPLFMEGFHGVFHGWSVPRHWLFVELYDTLLPADL